MSHDKTTALSFKISRGPWFHAAKPVSDTYGLRTYLWLPTDFRDVVGDETGEIKLIKGSFEFDGTSWQLFELPKFDAHNEDHSVVTCTDGRDRHYLRIPNTPACLNVSWLMTSHALLTKGLMMRLAIYCTKPGFMRRLARAFKSQS